MTKSAIDADAILKRAKPRVNRRVVGSRTICLMIQMSRAPWRHDRTGRLARRLHLVRRRRIRPSEELRMNTHGIDRPTSKGPFRGRSRRIHRLVELNAGK